MVKIKDRVDSIFSRYGEPFLINGVTPAKGFFTQLDKSRMDTYFDYVEQGYITRPGLICFTDADVTVAAEDTVELDDRVYTIKKMAKRRVEDTIVMQILVMI